LPTTDALFAQEVEQKMSNLLAGFLAPILFERKSPPRLVSDMPPSEDSNSDVLKPARRTAWAGGGTVGQT
jgi:hypothetical protein